MAGTAAAAGGAPAPVRGLEDIWKNRKLGIVVIYSILMVPSKEVSKMNAWTLVLSDCG